jgi:hypothetical protein
VAFTAGLEKIRSVSSTSISLPGSPIADRLKKAVRSETRAACCMLWVTMMIVYSVFSWSIRSSMARVEIGSSAEQGSSISSTSGATAVARAMHSRCCCPPERPEPGLASRSLTSFHRLAPRRFRSTISSSADFLYLRPVSFTPAATLS